MLLPLSSLSTGFDKLEYGTMRVSTPRLTLEQPIRWLRDAEHPRLTGAVAGRRQNHLLRRQLSPGLNAEIRPRRSGTRRGSSSPAPCMPRLSVRCVCPGAGWRTAARPGVVAKTVVNGVPAAGAAGLEDEPA